MKKLHDCHLHVNIVDSLSFFFSNERGSIFVFVFVGHGRTDNIFLVPMHGGIWTLCIDLSENEMRQLGPYGFPNAVKCISYLAENTDSNASEEYSQHGSYQATRRPSMRELNLPFSLVTFHHVQSFFVVGMQNLSISCSLVCLIILGSAALLGAFGICQRQISAILVTGVMYLLAGMTSASFNGIY